VAAWREWSRSKITLLNRPKSIHVGYLLEDGRRTLWAAVFRTLSWLFAVVAKFSGFFMVRCSHDGGYGYRLGHVPNGDPTPLTGIHVSNEVVEIRGRIAFNSVATGPIMADRAFTLSAAHADAADRIMVLV
jgi:hypothetical protein